ncbi:MAG: hypothetical protein ISS66_08315 [Desulfobacteraceae bacterium]|nr:hypothetical protein [Desulfobacteraceae bacterium]
MKIEERERVDVVVSEKDFERFSGILGNEGFSLLKEADEFALTYRGGFVCFQKMVESLPVSVDLLVGMVQSRQTDAAYSFDYLWKNSEIREVTGFGVKASAEARVVDREMLMALKINSMRMADQRDIISLCAGEVDTGKVANHLTRVSGEKIKEHVGSLLSLLEEQKSRDTLKGVFVFSDSVLDGLLNRARATLAEIDTKL